MVRKAEDEIMNYFRKNSLKKISILQLMKSLKKKSYQRIYEAVKSLENQEMIKSEKIGNINLISLYLTRQTVIKLSFLDEQEAIAKKIPNYEKIVAINEISPFLIIVTGSYAKGKETKKSDLDLVIIIPDNQDVLQIQKLVENITLLFIPKIHLYVFKRKDFLEMLTDKNENYGKEIFRYHYILKNAQTYYEILKEAIEHGFKG